MSWQRRGEAPLPPPPPRRINWGPPALLMLISLLVGVAFYFLADRSDLEPEKGRLAAYGLATLGLTLVSGGSFLWNHPLRRAVAPISVLLLLYALTLAAVVVLVQWEYNFLATAPALFIALLNYCFLVNAVVLIIHLIRARQGE